MEYNLEFLLVRRKPVLSQIYKRFCLQGCQRLNAYSLGAAVTFSRPTLCTPATRCPSEGNEFHSCAQGAKQAASSFGNCCRSFPNDFPMKSFHFNVSPRRLIICEVFLCDMVSWYENFVFQLFVIAK